MNKTELNIRKAILALEHMLKFVQRNEQYCNVSSIEDDAMELLDEVESFKQAHDPE
jgi:hypothetical protein